MRCHYIPRAYLLRFCHSNEAPLIGAYDKVAKSFLHVSVGNVAVQGDYYPQEVEAQLASAVEDPANRVIESLLAMHPISDEERIALALYVAVMLKRVPAGRERARALVPGVLQDTIRGFVSHVRRLVDEQSLDPTIAEHRIDEAFELEERYTRDVPKELIVQAESPWPSAKIVAAIVGMRWRVMVTDGPIYFMTTDNPAFFFTSYGLSRAQSELCLPLNTQTALHANWQGDSPFQFVRVRQAMVKEVNRRLASKATRWLFYNQQAPWVETIANKKHLYLSESRWQ
ncbi:MAG: DUF4238 domain-containing protein [Acidobacteria bacterium]|nr:DUF4238 domain-containing protein [Acidobacteriota bacterium]